MKKNICILLIVIISGYNVYSGTNLKIYDVNFTGTTLFIDVDAETWNTVQMANWDFEIYTSGVNIYFRPNYVSSNDANLVTHDGSSNLPVYNLFDISCVLWLPGTTANVLLNATGFPVDTTQYGLFWTTRGGWSGDKIHQGWIKIIHNSNNTFTLLNYGYSLNPNTSIQAGTDVFNPCSQEVITDDASSVTISAAVLNGLVIGKGTAINDITFDYGTTTSYGSSAYGNPSSVTGTENADINANISGLDENTTYHFRINAFNNVGTHVYGADNTFTTLTAISQTITFDSLFAQTYGDAGFDPGATASSGLEVTYSSSDTNVATIESNKVHIAGVGTGTVTIYADQAGDGIYAAAPQVSQPLAINQKVIRITDAMAANKEYDGITDASVSGATLFGIVDTDDVTLQDATSGIFANANVGTAIAVTTNMSLAGAAAGNYSLEGQPSLTADITAKELTVTAADKSKTYGDENPALTIIYTGFVGTDNEDSVVTAPTATTTATQYSDAGSYNIVPAGGEASNYTFSYVNGTLTVNKASLDATADDATREEGNANPVFTLSYSGFISTDDATVIDVLPTATCAADTSSAAGEYDIVLSGGSDNNYDLILHNGTLTVTPATAISTIAADGISIYPNPAGDYIYIKNLPEETAIGIFNIQGKLLKNSIANGSEEVDVSDLPSGVYIIKLSGKEVETIAHFVK
jgi:hypothetical protein